jgi:hypothetical protein
MLSPVILDLNIRDEESPNEVERESELRREPPSDQNLSLSFSQVRASRKDDSAHVS